MLAGKKLDAQTIEAAAAEATRNVDVIEDINGSIEYRTHLAQVYVTRAIQAALAA
jgi:CO/xanthine dehydrogenase FAD-binding subunit